MRNVFSLRRILQGAMALAAPVVFFNASANFAQAGTVILEGSDAIGLHCTQGGDAGACTYEAQVWKALDGASALPIAAIGSVPTIGSDGSGVTIDDFATVAAAAALGGKGLGQYAALYFTSTGGCCTEDDTLITAIGASALVSGYLASGGTVMIENYIGGAAWDFVVGAGGVGNAHTGGVGGGLGGSTCSDNEKVTAVGLANGFTQPPVIGCWTHQGYDGTFFGGLGFTKSFFDNADYGAGFSSLLSNGVTKTGGATPEPSSILLMGAGLAGLGFIGRRRKAARQN